MLVSYGGTPTWRLHTGLCKFVQNISTNIWSLGKRTDLKFGKMSYLFISYHIIISWLYTLNGFRIIFYCVTVQPKNCLPSSLPSSLPPDENNMAATYSEIRLNCRIPPKRDMVSRDLPIPDLSQRPPEKEPRGQGCELQPLLDMWIIRYKGDCQLTASLSLSVWDDVEAKRQRWKYKGLRCDRGSKIRQSAIVHQFENSSIQHDRSVRKNRILRVAKLHEQEHI